MTSSLLSRHDGVGNDHVPPHKVSAPQHASASLPDSKFDLDQAAILQNSIRDVAPEAHPSDSAEYPALETNGSDLDRHSDGSTQNMLSNNGVAPALDFAFDASYTYPSTGLSQSQEELDLDPAALLESLANFDHPPAHTNLPISNDHFASLLQAAATAGGHEATQQDRSGTRRSTRQSAAQYDLPLNSPQKRKRAAKSTESEVQSFLITNTKRKKASDIALNEEAQLEREREIWGPEDNEEDDDHTNFESMNEHPPIGSSEARAAGVHSAAALFRRPSSASKKYTRPPMSKVFTSLELSAESFLHMQAAAKAYMLDPEHSERKDCVGSRGGGDGTMVRLKLFECVRYFMDDLGWGERCWGRNAQGAEYRTLSWPRTSNRIISLATPLLRRIVTNERQRLYAIETRSNARATDAKLKSGTMTRRERQESRTPLEDTMLPRHHSEEQAPDIDPKLDQYHYSLEPSFATASKAQAQLQFQDTSSDLTSHAVDGDVPAQPSLDLAAFGDSPKYILNILRHGRRIRAPVTLDPLSCPGFPSLVQHIHNLLCDEGAAGPYRIQVLGPGFLREVEDEEAWLDIVALITECEWMDETVRIVVDVTEKT
ncbi:MAG: hypothetical protein M1818_004635 [Claussenomyces sp. TS43310]|nr:MAG: hypothetical protein M1818_004635 [Claussenomyces sp. TS43310]